MQSSSTSAVVVPIRSFKDGKSRFTFGSHSRTKALVKTMAGFVVNAANGYQTYILTKDVEVVEWARSERLGTFEDMAFDLNDSLALCSWSLWVSGLKRVAIVLGDLPLIKHEDIEAALTANDLWILGNSNQKGTNILAFDLPIPLNLCFGQNSYQAHLASINGLGLPYCEAPLSGASFDLDSPEDLQPLQDYARDNCDSDFKERLLQLEGLIR